MHRKYLHTHTHKLDLLFARWIATFEDLKYASPSVISESFGETAMVYPKSYKMEISKIQRECHRCDAAVRTMCRLIK